MWGTIGHDKAVGILQRSLDVGRISHAYLLAGPRQVGKGALALELAQALNCTAVEKPCGDCRQCSRIARGLHADVKIVGVESAGAGEGRGRLSISIDQVRDAQREASLKPYEGSYRVFIFDGAEQLSEEAANSLLKTLEEPPAQVVLVLLASDAGALLPTMVSRCQTLELRPVAASVIGQILQERYGADASSAGEVARLSEGRPGWAIEAVASEEVLQTLDNGLTTIEGLVRSGVEERFAYAADLASSMRRDREGGRQGLALWLAWWRDVLLVKEGAPGLATYGPRLETLESVAASLSSAQVAKAIQDIQKTMSHLDRNVNARLALEDLMLSLPRP